MREVFPVIPASAGPLWFLGILGVFLAGLLALFVWCAWASRHTVVLVADGGLRIANTPYGRRIPLAELIEEGAIPVDLTRDLEYQPVLRTNGIGLPGYGAGWFRLRDGQKALAFLTDRRRVLYLPTRAGYGLLVSVADPDRVIDAIRRARQTGAAAPPRAV